jgi:hypothetical protein
MRIVPWVCGGLVVLAAVMHAQQQRPSAGQPPTVGVTIALKAGASSYEFAGQASCTYAPIAAIYGVVSEQWNVEQSEGSRSLQLTLWRPKNASGDMFNLSVSGGARPQTVNTVKATSAPAPQGSGSVTLTRAGKGGTFTVNATTAAGGVITGTIKCDAFTPAIAEGGD